MKVGKVEPEKNKEYLVWVNEDRLVHEGEEIEDDIWETGYHWVAFYVLDSDQTSSLCGQWVWQEWSERRHVPNVTHFAEITKPDDYEDEREYEHGNGHF
jgi:hypothetical protein